MRRVLILMMAMGLLLLAAAPAGAAGAAQQKPEAGGQGHWLTRPDATPVPTEVAGSSGKATVDSNGATITVRTTGLTPGDAVTAWIVYFNGGCEVGEAANGSIPETTCGPDDLDAGEGGIVQLAGHVVGASGNATFSGRINVGDDPEIGPPFWVAYDPVSPDFHIVIRSHGPKVPSEMPGQIHSVDGGCVDQDLSTSLLVDDVPGDEIPDAVGECGDLQLFVFES
jgi:hypothetical protein